MALPCIGVSLYQRRITMKTSGLQLALWVLPVILPLQGLNAQTSATDVPNVPIRTAVAPWESETAVAMPPVVELSDRELDAKRRKTAVTLNYCRAALHRIRRAPSKSIVMEEQQRILNNLDLNQIEDPEVISLYRSILDEIGQVEISDRERFVIEEQFRRGLQRKMGTDIFVIGAQAATGQLGSVIQTGANSWWDYRNTQVKRDTDLWQVEKTQFTTLVTRSSTFLDSFWKLSRKNEIPDRWLLRDQDLDQLGDVLAETDAERRLRMLGRLEKFMECYPPYWYYLARTQQQLGQLDAAASTFQRLAELGRGHFRQDDMLASSMANLSLIYEKKGDPEAVTAAAAACEYSGRNWEANLVAAWVLERHQKYAQAEDLILCNLDYELEADQSTVALVTLYYNSDDRSRLAEVLEDQGVLQRIPIPSLLLCVRKLGPENLPKNAEMFLASTLQATRRQSARMNSIAVAATPAWRLSDADSQIADGATVFRSAGYRPTARGMEVNFVTPSDSASDSGDGDTLRMTLNYPGSPAIHVVMRPNDDQREQPALTGAGNRRNPLFGGSFSGVVGAPAARVYHIHEIEVDGLKLSFHRDTDRLSEEEADARRVLKPEFPDDGSATRS